MNLGRPQKSRRLRPPATLLALASIALAATHSAAVAQTNPDRLAATVKTLGGDAFGGRAPGTPGEDVTVRYLVDQFARLGLQPGGADGGWTQPVTLVHTQIGPARRLRIEGDGSPLDLRQNRDIYVSTLRPADRVTITDAPLVYVGYGVVAPERGRDDFQGVDLHGKVAVFLIGPPALDGAAVMTQYARWTYKFEEAARRGAVAALLVHEMPEAQIDWPTAIGPLGQGYDIARGAGEPPSIALRGLLQRDVAVALFRRAGLDFEAQKGAARLAGFKAIAMGDLHLSFDAPETHGEIHSRNVIAKLEGAKAPDQTVMFAAHWDAFGAGPPDAEGDTIRRGANDDALGVAGVLELARAFATAPRPARTVVFALWTAEERGLLGSEAYAARPLYPLAKTAANFTLDIMNTAGRSHDLVLVGAGLDTLEDDLSRAATTQGRRVTPEASPERGYFYRADHFSLVKRGVPALLLMAMAQGPDLVVGGRDAGRRWAEDYITRCYHKPCDTWSAQWDLRGAAEDIDLVYAVGRAVADTRTWPAWKPGAEFKAIRDRSADQRP